MRAHARNNWAAQRNRAWRREDAATFALVVLFVLAMLGFAVYIWTLDQDAKLRVQMYQDDRAGEVRWPDDAKSAANARTSREAVR